MKLDRRQFGVLLHPTSLPGTFGIGDIGPEAERFLEWLASAGVSLWQVLPLGPTGFGDSPYQCFSAFAGNPYLISPDRLLEAGLLDRRDLKTPGFPSSTVDFGPVIEWKVALLKRAFERFSQSPPADMAKRFAAWRKGKNVAAWLESFTLFMAIKSAHGGASWDQWSPELRACKPAALAAARKAHARDIDFHAFCQFVFFDQWSRLRERAHALGIAIIGDAPIYVAYDSADTWSQQGLFKLAANGLPTCVAGVPPDYFSATGQLWGNPIYRWDAMKKTGFAWWIDRMRAQFDMVDIVRLDHFRGFEAYWEVPFGHATAERGKWVPAPGAALFAALEKKFGDLPVIAENLGVITEAVETLRDDFNLPGMKVLQFGFGTAPGSKSSTLLTPDPENAHKLFTIEPFSVVYTGTHDNPTTTHWWREFATEGERALMKAQLRTNAVNPADDLIHAAVMSPGAIAVTTMQDLLGLGAEARMNYPGRDSGNWGWRMNDGATSRQLAADLKTRLALGERLVVAGPVVKAPAAKPSKKKSAVKKKK